MPYIEFECPESRREEVMQVFSSRGWTRDPGARDEPISSPHLGDNEPWVRLSLNREKPFTQGEPESSKSMAQMLGIDR